jgi:hypothetical protein
MSKLVHCTPGQTRPGDAAAVRAAHPCTSLDSRSVTPCANSRKMLRRESVNMHSFMVSPLIRVSFISRIADC